MENERHLNIAPFCVMNESILDDLIGRPGRQGVSLGAAQQRRSLIFDRHSDS